MIAFQGTKPAVDLESIIFSFCGYFYQNYTFLGCPSNLDPSQFPVIDCLSNDTFSVLATSSMDLVRRAMNVCNVISIVPVPGSWSFQNNGNGFLSHLSSGDLFLSWNVPDCRTCGAKGGTCGRQSSSSLDILCTVATSNGKKRGQALLEVIGFSVFLPLVILPVLFISILCCKCILAREQMRLRRANIVIIPSNNSRTVIPQLTNGKAGLDDSTIESYPKIVLDDSCSNIAGSSDLVRPICLDEYHPKQTLRFIPSCEHYFHVDCIDKWLRINST